MRHMVLLVAAVSVAGLGAVAAAITVGRRVAEPTVVPDPYEAGLHYDEQRHAHDVAEVGPRAPPRCDLARTPCARSVGSATVTLEITPRPPRAMADLDFTVSLVPAAAAGAGEARISLGMPGMYMGENRVVLAPSGPGRWKGRGVVVRCPSGRRTWMADVELPAPGPGAAPVRASFTFEVAG